MIDNLQPGWLWMIGGILLLIAEVIAPGFFLVLSARPRSRRVLSPCSSGSACLRSLTLFAIYAVVAVMFGRKAYANRTADSADPLLNDRGARMIGKSVTVIEPVDEHSGRVRVGDSEWSARGGPGRPGERVRITGVEGNCLIVEPERLITSE